MIDKIIAYSIKNKFIIILLVLALIAGGVYCLKTVNLDSTPDITDNQVQVITVSQNLATEDIEQFVTYPVEQAMSNLPGVTSIRSISRFGLSVVTIVFKDNMGTYLPRQIVQEKLGEVSESIPSQFGAPEMGPITTGLGEIFQYTIKPKKGAAKKYSPTELRTIQDWIVKRQMTMIPGVVDVNSFGGNVKQYEIALNPDKLNSMHISIGEVFAALENNNLNAGGAYIEKNHMPGSHPSLEMYRQRIEIADANLRVQKAAFLPKFFAEAGSQKIGSASGYYTYSVGVSIPLFFHSRLGRAQSASIESGIARQNYSQAKIEAETGYQSVSDEYRKWAQSVKYYSDVALPVALEQRKGAVAAYREGAIDYVGFIQNMKDAIQVEFDYWDSFENYLDTGFRLEYLLDTLK